LNRTQKPYKNMKNNQANFAAMRPNGRHEGSYQAVRAPVPKPRDYADALSVLFHEKVSSPLKRAARRALELIVGASSVPGQTASAWLVNAVPTWSQRKLTKHFRRTAQRLQRGYCAVPGRFQPVEGAERLKCFSVLAEEVKRRAREFNNTARKLREQAHAAKFARPGGHIKG